MRSVALADKRRIKVKVSVKEICSVELHGKRRIFEKVIVVLLAIFVFGCSFFGVWTLGQAISRTYRADVKFEGEYKNVILMIGDGMGFNHIDCAEGYYGETSFMRAQSLGCSKTITDSEALFGPTDSAAAATALSTGKKTDNGAIARYMGKDILTNAELAKAKGMAVGIIASEGVSGATPAAFSSHADNRGDSEDIFDGQLLSNIDLFAGGKKDYYDERKDRIENSGYKYVNDAAEEFGSAEKIWAAYDVKPLPESDGDGITLTEIVEKSLSFLENASENGYFLMIEESYIDKRSHANDIHGMLERMKSYDSAIEKTVTYARSRGDTLVVATADHETGRLTIPKNADLKNPSDRWFGHGGHTRRKVPFFYFSPIGPIADVIDNTQIADLCRYYINNRQTLNK